jgi:DNA repair exonuclease SbcCD nuclease subunit
MSKIVFVSDPHFSSRPQDDYFFQLFPKVIEVAKEHSCTKVTLLGDLAQNKDNHSNALVNRITDGVYDWSRFFDDVTLIRGNHDSLSGRPYFDFLSKIPKISYIYEPTVVDKFVFLPHTRDPLKDWANLSFKDKVVLAHVTVNNCFTETGQRLESEVGVEFFKEASLVMSGDIHLHQTLPMGMGSDFIYVGSPYNIRFADNFAGGVLIFDDNTLKWERVLLDFPRRLTFDVKTSAELKTALKSSKSDKAQVKLRIHIDQENIEGWRELKEQCQTLIKERGYDMFQTEINRDWKKVTTSVKQEQIKKDDFESFCEQNNVNMNLKNFGLNILKEI